MIPRMGGVWGPWPRPWIPAFAGMTMWGRRNDEELVGGLQEAFDGGHGGDDDADGEADGAVEVGLGGEVAELGVELRFEDRESVFG